METARFRIGARRMTPGSAAAAILASGAGCLVLGVATILSHVPAIGKALTIFPPSGSLSGKAMLAVIVWLVLWAILDRRLRHRRTRVDTAVAISIGMIIAGLAITFPPVAALFAP